MLEKNKGEKVPVRGEKEIKPVNFAAEKKKIESAHQNLESSHVVDLMVSIVGF